MKQIALLVVLLTPVSWAAPTPDEYTVDVHVSSSHWLMSPGLFNTTQAVQELDVLIGGKHYELEAATTQANLQAGVALLALGDYKAKLVQDLHPTTYESSQAYEFLFPDRKTRKFIVVGQAE